MEDFYVDHLPGIKFHSVLITTALNDISTVLESKIKSDFVFLSAMRSLIKHSSHGSLILDGNLSYVKYSSVSDEYTVSDVLKKRFGFSDKYIEKLGRVVVKFLKPVGTAPIQVQNEEPNAEVEYVLDCLKDLSISKLEELLPLSIEQIKKAFNDKVLSYKSTFREIRDYVKSIKGGPNKENKVLEDTSSEDEDQPITDCGQYIVFKEENFNYIKTVIKGRKYNYSDTSSFLNAVLDYCREKELFM